MSDRGAGIGALVGAGWGAAGIGAGLVTGTLVVTASPVLAVAAGATIALGIDMGLGAAVGKAFNLHHEAGGKVLRALRDHVGRGHAVVYAVVDPHNAIAIAEALSDRTVHQATITGEEQAKVAALQESA